MTVSRAEDLWTRFLSEGQLAPDEEQELLGAMEADPVLRDRLVNDKQFDGLLGAVCAPDADAFVKSFHDRLAVEGDSKFIAKVEERIRAKRHKSNRLVYGWDSHKPNGLIYGLVAAGVAVILLIAMFSSSEQPAPVVKTPVREAVPPPPPPSFAPSRGGASEGKPPAVIETPPAPEKPKVEVPVPPPPPEPPKPEAPPAPAVPESKPEPKPVPKVTQVIVARIVRGEGEGQELAAGAGFEVGKGASTLAYPDGTKLDLGAETAVLDLLDAKGKTLTLEKGVLTADVVKQQQPMVVKTPHAEIRVLGTTLRVTVEPGSTRLDVLSGKVRLTRLLDGKYADVITGHYAVVGAGIDLVAKPLAPKPKPVLLQENFQGGLDAKWKPIGSGALVKVVGQLDIDLTTKPASPDGWSGGGIVSRQSFAPSMAVSLDVDLPVIHPSVVAAVVFIPQGQKRGSEGVYRFQLRGSRYSLTTESGEARDLVGADRAGAAGRERWRIEVDGAAVRLLVNDVEVLKHKHGLAVAPGYAIEIDGSARADAPSGARVGFDNVVVEALK